MRSAILPSGGSASTASHGDGSRQGGVDAAVDDDESVGTELSVTSGGLIASGRRSPAETFGVKEIDEREEKDVPTASWPRHPDLAARAPAVSSSSSTDVADRGEQSSARHARAKQQYNADEELATVIEEDEFALVCYLWCKSHLRQQRRARPPLRFRARGTRRPSCWRCGARHRCPASRRRLEHEWMRRRRRAILERELLSKSAGTLRARCSTRSTCALRRRPDGARVLHAAARALGHAAGLVQQGARGAPALASAGG